MVDTIEVLCLWELCMCCSFLFLMELAMDVGFESELRAVFDGMPKEIGRLLLSESFLWTRLFSIKLTRDSQRWSSSAAVHLDTCQCEGCVCDAHYVHYGGAKDMFGHCVCLQLPGTGHVMY